MIYYSYFNTTNSPMSPTISINGTTGFIEPTLQKATVFSATLTILLAVLAGVVSFCTIAGNLLVLVAFFVERNIRTASNYFIVSLATTDLLIGLFSMNLFTVYLLIGYWPLGNVWCDLWLSLDYTACLTSQYTVLFITVDRFFSVRLPVRYRNWRTNSKVGVMIAITWILPSTIFFTTIMGWQHFTGEKRRRKGECFAEFTSYPIFITVLTVCYFWVTLFVMIGLYVGIYKAAWELHVKNKTRHKNMTSLMAMASHTMSQIGVGMTWKSGEQQQTRTSPQPPLKEEAEFSDTPRSPPRSRKNNKLPTPSPKNNNNLPPPSSVENEKPSQANNGMKSCRFQIHVKTVQFSKDQEISEGYTSTIASSSERIHQRSLSGPPEDFHELRYIDEEFDSLLTTPSSEEDILLTSMISDFTSDSLTQHVNLGLQGKHNNKSTSTGRNSCSSSTVYNGITTHKASLQASTPKCSTSSSPVKTSIMEAARKLNARRKQSIGIVDLNSTRSENRARKALRTISFILGAFLLCWTPFHILVLVKSFCSTGSGTGAILRTPCVNEHIYNLAYWLCYLNSPINPFCYALANAQFKMAFKRVLRGDIRTS